MQEHHYVYGGELSYFTRKLEAAMTFYGRISRQLGAGDADRVMNWPKEKN